jgi:predicted unusual protein kinase regulating ubiquinone biosynthesis (AarF/ABC1/UbiB family)
VVKVQYPGIAAICAADLRQVRRLMPLGRLLGSPASQLEAVYAELKRSIHQELDYETEQDSVQRFHDHFAGWPNLQLPRAIGPLCRPGILVMEDVPGRPMAEAEQAPAAVRQQLALTLTEWFLEQSFGLGLLHADPHPGNLAWTDDGRLVVYDFGSVLEVEPSLLKAYLALFEALRGPDSAALEPAFQALGGRRRGSSPPFELYERIHRIMHPLLQPGAIWDFRASALHQQLIALLPQVMAAIGSLQPASGTLLVNRTLEGHYWTLYRLGARLPVHDLLMQHIERHFAQGPDDHGGLSA